ncbi:hypothetical protein [Ignatzschineria cameli]|uniref:Fimbrial protein n=1 Tax=Ignatzschineria cameli TaxID=2182793 RepID=A0ABX5KYJ2_9GAMM|nr:hypothetical protein [Ignatzschineria cameli]PWD83604.1 hypothetical protein DC080_07910 [Ignatzschineria cameli]PWD89037.1 hypothetical protein DC079_08075 [Ignatzschineria cameli]PWD90083.1 hypothetical protein DC081_07805 [Ignatzschineria cameli]PWD90746.1 hypothetical protein DC078_07715 [Ignatzschineria cameli]
MKKRFLKIVGKGFIATFLLHLMVLTTVNAAVEYYPPLEGNSTDKFLVNVERDRKIGDNSKLTENSCPIELYINDQNVGSYLINEHQQYYLSPGSYSFRVENCLGQKSVYDMDMSVNNSQYYQDYILSVDVKGKPFIIKNTLKPLYSSNAQ